MQPMSSQNIDTWLQCVSGTDLDQTHELSHMLKCLIRIQPPTTANTKYLWVISLRFFSL